MTSTTPDAAQGRAAGTLRTRRVDACPVCGDPRTTTAFAARDALLGLPGSFTYMRCAACGSVYQNPQVIEEDLLRCYGEGYFTHAPAAPDAALAGRLAPGLRARVRDAVLWHADRRPCGALGLPLQAAGWLLSWLGPVRRRARFGLLDALGTSGSGRPRCLEIGPGRGDTLCALRYLGWDAVGLDLDPAAAAVARATSGCAVHVGTIATADFTPGTFQAIYMSHVLEHLPKVRQALDRCVEWLAPAGWLVLVYPNPDSLVNRIWGRCSPNWDPPRHLVLPSRRAISAVLRERGLQDLQVATRAHTAAKLSAVARHYRNGGCGWVGREPPRWTDRLTLLAEHAATAVRLPWGEEIVAVGQKPWNA